MSTQSDWLEYGGPNRVTVVRIKPGIRPYNWTKSGNAYYATAFPIFAKYDGDGTYDHLSDIESTKDITDVELDGADMGNELANQAAVEAGTGWWHDSTNNRIYIHTASNDDLSDGSVADGLAIRIIFEELLSDALLPLFPNLGLTVVNEIRVAKGPRPGQGRPTDLWGVSLPEGFSVQVVNDKLLDSSEERRYWLPLNDYIYDGADIEVKIGNYEWTTYTSDYKTIAKGRIRGISEATDDVVTFKCEDRLEEVIRDIPVKYFQDDDSSDPYYHDTDNEGDDFPSPVDKPVPLILGKVNRAPLVPHVYTGYLVWCVSSGEMSDITAVYNDDGEALSTSDYNWAYSVDYDTTSLVVNGLHSPADAKDKKYYADVEGPTGIRDEVADTLLDRPSEIALGILKDELGLVDKVEIDKDSFTDAGEQSEVSAGIRLPLDGEDKANKVYDVIERLLACDVATLTLDTDWLIRWTSYRPDREGQFATSITLTDEESELINQNLFEVSFKPSLDSAFDYTIQFNRREGVDTEWQSAHAVSTVTKNLRRREGKREIKTALNDYDDAISLASRLVWLRKTPPVTCAGKAGLELIKAAAGDAVTVSTRHTPKSVGGRVDQTVVLRRIQLDGDTVNFEGEVVSGVYAVWTDETAAYVSSDPNKYFTDTEGRLSDGVEGGRLW